MIQIAALERAATSVCADGTDPTSLAAVLAWCCRPRTRPDVLRRWIRDRSESGRGPASSHGEALAELAREGFRPDGALVDVALRVVRTWVRSGVRVALVGDSGYPDVLSEGWPQSDAPVLLAFRGEPPASAGPGVAVVGSRNASAYGIAVAELLAGAVSRAGGRVVSGGAVGIDAAAHAAAIGLPGGTTVVLGCGHAVAYPAPHARPGGLFDRVLDDGGSIVSELLPEVSAHPGVIRARNRIVAGLARVTVVVEGGQRSGALLTATAAVERGREVLAVPGDILAPGSAAPLRLLGEGARPCTGPDDVLALLGPDLVVPPPAGEGGGSAAGTGTLPEGLRETLVRAGPRGVAEEDLVLAHGGDPGHVVALLTRARIAGIVERIPGGVRLRSTRPSDR